MVKQAHPTQNNRKSQQSGQALIEYILLLAVMLMAWNLVRSGLEEMQLVRRVTQGPWAAMSGMIESGVLVPPDQARATHPSHIDRGVSVQEFN